MKWLVWVSVFPLSIGYFFKPSLAPYRMMIEKMDDMIYDSLTKRLELSRYIGSVKKKSNDTILDIKREQYIWERLQKKRGLDRDFVDKIWTIILEESKKEQLSQIP